MFFCEASEHLQDAQAEEESDLHLLDMTVAFFLFFSFTQCYYFNEQPPSRLLELG